MILKQCFLHTMSLIVQMVSYSSVFAKIYTKQKTGPIFDDFSVYLRLLVKTDDNGIVGKDKSTGELG